MFDFRLLTDGFIFTVFFMIFYWWAWAREESDTAFVICLFFRHISFTRYVFSFLTIDALLALSPPLETNSKIRGTNFDAGGVKPLPFPPHVPCLFHPFQDHHALERHYTWLACSGAEFWELKLCYLVGLHLLLGYTWCNISRFIIHSSHRKWPPSPPHFILGDTNQ